MGEVFVSYANFYDTLYQEKDYSAECNYLEQLFKQSAHPVKKVLDLGCGTGRHDIELCRRGYEVTGIDRSQKMIDIAIAQIPAECKNLRFFVHDLTQFDLHEQFDAVVSMFAVFSYIIDNADLDQAFNLVNKHLTSQGLFFFDAWSGPAVLSEKPEQRIKEVKSGDSTIIRIATPALDLEKNTVDVNYHLMEISNQQVKQDFFELHKMRYVFIPEIDFMLGKNGLQLKQSHPFLRPDQKVTEKDWEIAFLATKR